MNLHNELLKLEISVKKLSPNKAAIVAACCAERLFNGYKDFVLKSGWGSVEQLGDIIKFCWNTIEKDNCDVMLCMKKLAECETLMPDTEEFEVPLAAFALDSTLAVRSVLKCLIEKDASNAITAIRALISSTDLKLQVVANSQNIPEEEIEMFISQHPLMQQDIEYQSSLLVKLHSNEVPNIEFICSSRDTI